MPHFVGIEGGGTKFVCVHGTGPDDLHDRMEIKTQSADITMAEIAEYIRVVQKKVPIQAIGASVFGPIDLDVKSPTYGYITTASHKTGGWTNCDFVGTLRQVFDGPIGFDTDVNAAAIGEYRWGAAQGLSDFIYLTIGTGIGGGAMVNGRLLHGAMHAEMGHLLIRHDTVRDPFPGNCAYHHDCWEGLAAGPAMKARWHVHSALDLPENHAAWDLEAHYLGLGLASLILALSPKRIIMGGGVMRQAHLLPKVRAKTLEYLANFVQSPNVIGDFDRYIVKPGLGENAGICGGIALAEKSLAESIQKAQVS